MSIKKNIPLFFVSVLFANLSTLSQYANSELNDTGITWGANYPQGNNQNCEGIVDNKKNNEQKTVKIHIIDAQDCKQGRDKTSANNNDGLAGFSYQKIDRLGQKLPSSADQWHCVLDTVSGLMWESKKSPNNVKNNSSIKVSAGPRSSDDQFTWYSSQSNNNAGKIGHWNKQGQDCSGYTKGKPTTFCHTEQFVSRTNKQGLCGHNDWKIPSRSQLTSLINFGHTQPAIDTRYFPNTHNGFYWSSTPVSNRETDAWAQSFEFGFVSPIRRTDKLYVRLVRENKK